MSNMTTLDHRIDQSLQALVCDAQDPVSALAALVDALRPRRANDAVAAGQALERLTQRLDADDDLRDALRTAVIELLANRKALHLLTDSGVLASGGFFTELSSRLGRKLLPDEINPERLKHLLCQIFRRDDDYRWVAAAADEAWLGLFHALDFPAVRGTPEAEKIWLQLRGALEVISYRITALGLEPEIVRIHPDVERYESPFLMQNVEIRMLFDDWLNAHQEGRVATLDHSHLLILFGQCEDIIARIRKQAAKTGASIALTRLLVRLTQNLTRARRLLATLEPKPVVDRNADRLRLLRELVAGENRKNSLRDLFSLNVELLADRITGHAGHAGEAYITRTRPEYFALLRSAMGAGVLVAIAALIKLSLIATHHAPLATALLYSANYAWCFVLMSALHFSLATKQPAMTANRIARSFDEHAEGHDRLEGLVEVIVRTLRSQFIALIGNFVTLIPLAAGLVYLWHGEFGHHYLDPQQARQVLAHIDPLAWTTWLWGAITGVWLFAAGLISGYYDNRAVYAHIPQRIAQRPFLRRLLGIKRTERLATFIENNLGAMAGSFWFGVLLGSTGAVGSVLGLPIDTLHVTFSTANGAYAVLALDGVTATIWIKLLLGIAVIGILNLTVSFGLALYVAMRARNVKFRMAGPLIRLVLLQLLKTPAAFFFPPRDPPPTTDEV